MSGDVQAEDLAHAGVFADLSESDLERVAAMFAERRFADGDHLIVQGQDVVALIVILSGQVAVTRVVDDAEQEVARLGPGTFLGEMSLLAGGPASATITAVGEVVAAVAGPEARDIVDLPGVRRVLDHAKRRREATNRLATVPPVDLGAAFGHRIMRPLSPADWRLMQDATQRVSDDTLRKRFFTLPKLHEAFLRRLAGVDYLDQFAWAVLEPDGVRLAAIGRYARLPDDADAAEIALIVTDDLQGQGLGSLLTVALGVAAEVHGITDLVAIALAENEGVQRLLERFGAKFGPGDRGQEVEAKWPVADVLAAAHDDHPVAALRAAATALLTPDVG